MTLGRRINTNTFILCFLQLMTEQNRFKCFFPALEEVKVKVRGWSKLRKFSEPFARCKPASHTSHFTERQNRMVYNSLCGKEQRAKVIVKPQTPRFQVLRANDSAKVISAWPSGQDTLVDTSAVLHVPVYYVFAKRWCKGGFSVV